MVVIRHGYRLQDCFLSLLLDVFDDNEEIRSSAKQNEKRKAIFEFIFRDQSVNKV